MAFGSSTTVLAKLKKKALTTKKAKEDKKRWDEQEKWNIYKEPLTGKQWKKTTIDDVLMDPANFNGLGDAMSSPHVSNMDIDYELDLLEFEGICERERNLPVSKMRYAARHDHRWLIMVRRMEFELYVTMSLERKVQSVVLWFIVSCYCAFAVFMNLLFGMKFAPTQSMGWITTALGTLMMGFFVYEPIGIVAGVALGELPQLWKLLHEHGDMIDKELDAVIMVQAVWRSKQQHRAYQDVVHDNRGAQAAIDERRRNELKIWEDKHQDELKAIVKLQSAYRGMVGRKIYAAMQKADREARAIVRKNNRKAFQKRMQDRANMLGAMSLADRRAKDEQARLEKEAYNAAMKLNRDAALQFLTQKVVEGRMKEKKNNAMMMGGMNKKPLVGGSAVAGSGPLGGASLGGARKKKTRRF